MNITRIPGTAQGRCKTVEHNGFIWTVATARGDSVAEQTRAALEQIDASLNEVGTDRHHIVEALVYLTDMSRKQRWTRSGAPGSRTTAGHAVPASAPTSRLATSSR